MREIPVLYLLVGLPGSGKTTRARALETEHGALRLTPDEWMMPLFGEPEAGGKRDVLEGRLVATALQALRAGASVALDFGLWGRDERAALVWLAEAAGARAQLVYCEVDETTQLERIRRRAADSPRGAFAMSAEELARWRASFDVPTPEELAGTYRPAPPRGCASWRAWAAARWPSLLA